MKKHVKLILTALAVYIVLLLLLLAAEAGDASASIRSFWDAVWFSLITMTTVGYGDLAPMTSPGRFLAVLVMLLGYSIIAVPTGIVAGETMREYKRPRNSRLKMLEEEYEEEEAAIKN